MASVTINEEGFVSDIHLEEWDTNTMSKELVDEILTQKGKTRNNFIVFAFTNKLFLYIRSLCVNNLFLWVNSPLYPEENRSIFSDYVNRLLKNTKTHCAIFHCFADEIKPGLQMIVSDSFLLESFETNGLDSELIEIPNIGAPTKDTFALFGLFNVTRNCRNEVNYFDTISKQPHSSVASNHGYIVARNITGKLCALSAVDILIEPRENLKQFIAFCPTTAKDKKQANSINLAMRLIADTTREKRLLKTGVPKDIDREALDMAYRKCEVDIARMIDLPIYLQNLLANIYYQSAILTLQHDKKEYSPDGIKKYLSNVSHVVTSIKYMPEFIKILRSTENKTEYNKIAEDMFYELKYDVTARKISQIRKSFLKFQKPIVAEIKDLYKYF